MLVRHIVEAVILAIAVACLNLLVPDDPGFLAATVNPYLLVAFAVGAYRGWIAGTIALVFGFGFVFLSFGVVLDNLFPEVFSPIDLSTLDPRLYPRRGTLGLSALLGIFIFGMIHFVWYRRTHHLQKEVEKFSRECKASHEQRGALLVTTSELERRVAGQRDSLSYLNSQWRKLSSQNVESTLRIIHDTVRELTGAERCSLWQHDPVSGELVVRTTAGWSTNAPDSRRLPVNGSIEGWVLRNGLIFSVKHLVRYDTLKRLDRGTIVYAVPLRAGDRIWGVIDVEQLPFERFNSYTEHLVHLGTTVPAAPLAQAIAYESGQDPVDQSADTGYPLCEQLIHVLNTEVTERRIDGASLSMVLIQITNYHELVSSSGLDGTSYVVRAIFSAAKSMDIGSVHCFHYKSDGQLAVVCPDRDFDGAALFFLDLLRWAAETVWSDIIQIRPELIVGYSSLASGVDNADSLLRMAENLLEMQKR